MLLKLVLLLVVMIALSGCPLGTESRSTSTGPSQNCTVVVSQDSQDATSSVGNTTFNCGDINAPTHSDTVTTQRAP